MAVLYRFILASGLLFALHFVLRRNLKFSKEHHINFFLQGTCNFSLNYVLTYIAEIYSPSAIIAVTFTSLLHMNIVGTWYFFKKPIHRNVIFGSIFGALGVAFLFYGDIKTATDHPQSYLGIMIGLVATAFASAGNMLAYRNHLMKVPVMAANTWGMFYGMVTTGVLCLLFQEPLVIPTSLKFWSALVYLAVPGTVLAFGAYMSLVGRIGAERAAYTTVISPVIAILISMTFENMVLTSLITTGMILCLIGNVLTLYRRKDLNVKDVQHP